MTTLWKLSGAGNDFLALIEPEEIPAAERIEAWCRRGVSLGADGLFVLRQERGSDGASVARMLHFNADGGRAELCVNGTRCAAELAFEIGWAEEQITIRTDAADIPARRIGPGIVELSPPPPAESPRPFRAPGPDGLLKAWYQRIGVPHLVVDWGTPLHDCPVDLLGGALRSLEELGAEGANVDFVHFVDPGSLAIRTYERGVEGETLACGSGILAAVACGLSAGLCSFPLAVTVASGFRLQVDGELVEQTVSRWTLRGDARLVGRFEALPGAEASPDNLRC